MVKNRISLNESEMKTKKQKNEKWNLCVSQTWPYT